MENLKIFNSVGHQLILVLFVIFAMACSKEQDTPMQNINNEKIKINQRLGGCTDFGDLVRERVSERDNIPIQSISSCYYYGPYAGGYCEYRCFTSQYGSPVYIIGDDTEGW